VIETQGTLLSSLELFAVSCYSTFHFSAHFSKVWNVCPCSKNSAASFVVVSNNILIFETELVNMSNRTWTYNGWQHGQAPSNEWIDGTNEFLNSAFSIPGVAENDTIKCS
jgi:hypothetical protein